MSLNTINSDSNTKALQIVESLLKLKGNEVCADCSSPRPRQASANLGVFLCMVCAGIHRGLGVHHSFVRSVSHDKQSLERALYMKSHGNLIVNEKYEARLPQNYKPNSTDSREKRECYIQEKQIRKAFIAKKMKSKKASNKIDNSSNRRVSNSSTKESNNKKVNKTRKHVNKATKSLSSNKKTREFDSTPTALSHKLKLKPQSKVKGSRSRPLKKDSVSAKSRDNLSNKENKLDQCNENDVDLLSGDFDFKSASNKNVNAINQNDFPNSEFDIFDSLSDLKPTTTSNSMKKCDEFDDFCDENQKQKFSKSPPNNSSINILFDGLEVCDFSDRNMLTSASEKQQSKSENSNNLLDTSNIKDDFDKQFSKLNFTQVEPILNEDLFKDSNSDFTLLNNNSTTNNISDSKSSIMNLFSKTSGENKSTSLRVNKTVQEAANLKPSKTNIMALFGKKTQNEGNLDNGFMNCSSNNTINMYGNGKHNSNSNINYVLHQNPQYKFSVQNPIYENGDFSKNILASNTVNTNPRKNISKVDNQAKQDPFDFGLF